MTPSNKRSRVALRSASAAAIFALGAAALTGCTATTAGGCELGPTSDGDLTLKLGTALPQTGNLAFLNPPEEAGVHLAVDEINAAGKGITIELTLGDSGNTENKAYDTEIPRLLNAGVQAIVGAASSGTSLAFIDRVIAECVVQFSPANTSAELTTYEDKGLYFRTAPSDVLQGEVLGNLIAADGHQRLGMIVLNDSYGTGLAGFVQAAFEAAGGEVVSQPTFNTGDTNFTSQINEVLAADPDAIVLITFDEALTIIPALTSQFPGANLYLVDGNNNDYSADFAAGTLEGAKATYPGVPESDLPAGFIDALAAKWLEKSGEPLEVNLYGPEAYDAVVLIALAALEARSTQGANISEKLREVSGGTGNGTKCTTFAECADIIASGGTADYDGASGPVTFDENGDPGAGKILINQYQNDNTFINIGVS
jgi:branched-chain amino acid transport system substrate-binding protein